jgi:serine/threonine protein phosphatase PrpC
MSPKNNSDTPFKTVGDFMGKAFEQKRNNLIADCFIAIHERFENYLQIDSRFSGTTCCVVLLTRRQLICANTGDSRAILGSYNEGRWIIKPISRDHKPD